MKKIYLSLIFSLFAFAGFSTTWYSQDSSGVGDASNLNHWWSGFDSTGTHPTTFLNPADSFIVQTTMMCSASTFTIAGTVIVNNVFFKGPENTGSGGGILNIGGDFIMTAAAGFGVPDDDGYDNNQYLNLSGNLVVADAAYFLNAPAYTIIVFNNPASTLSSPQYITWTSSAVGEWARMHIDSGAVQLLTNVTMPTSPDGPNVVNAILSCGQYTFDCNASGFSFQVNAGASLYTGNAAGIDGTLLNNVPPTLNSAATYGFNGTVAQVTGLLMPSSFLSGGSVIINNAAGVALSQNTMFNDGSALSLTSGHFIIGANTLTLSPGFTFSGTFSSSKMIVADSTGMVQKQFTEDGSFMFPIGDSISYAPISLSVTGSVYNAGAYLGVNVTPSKDPNNGNLTNYLNRYWSVMESGITGLSYSVTSATYVPGDVVGAEANISTGQFASSLQWIRYGVVNPVTHSLSATGVTDSVDQFTGISTPPSISISPSTAVCAGSGTTLTVTTTSAADSPLTYSWAPADGLSSTSESSVTATPGTMETYTVTVTDGNGFSATATTTVSVNPLPLVYEMSGGGTRCSTAAGLHINLSMSQPGIRYQLYLNDTTAVGSPMAGTDTALDFGADTAAGVYSIIATDTTTGCTSTMEGFVIINVIPTVVPSVTIMPSISDTICTGTTVSFSYTSTFGGDEPSFQWSVNGTPIGTFSPTYSYVPVNGDVVKITMISSATCAIPDTVSSSITMSVAHPVMPTVALSITPSDSVCAGTPVTISANPTYGGTAPTFLWIKNTIPVDSDSSYTFIPADADNIYLIMQSNYFCKTTATAYSPAIIMSVLAPSSAIPTVSIVARNGTMIGDHQADTLVAYVSNGGSSPTYQWYRNDSAIPGATNAIYYQASFHNKDSLSVIVTRHDVCGLSTVNSVVILINSVGVGSSAASSANLTLAPNPNKGTFMVKGTLGVLTDQNVSLEVTDLLGQVVYNSNVMARQGNLEEQISLSGIANGIYLLNVHSESGNSTLRFVVGQ